MLEPELVEKGGDVVGAVFETVRRPGGQRDPGPVAPQVGSDQPVPAAERQVRREPVQIGRHGQAVEEQEHRGAGRPRQLPHEHGAPTGKRDLPPRRQRERSAGHPSVSHGVRLFRSGSPVRMSRS